MFAAGIKSSGQGFPSHSTPALMSERSVPHVFSDVFCLHLISVVLYLHSPPNNPSIPTAWLTIHPLYSSAKRSSAVFILSKDSVPRPSYISRFTAACSLSPEGMAYSYANCCLLYAIIFESSPHFHAAKRLSLSVGISGSEG